MVKTMGPETKERGFESRPGRPFFSSLIFIFSHFLVAKTAIYDSQVIHKEEISRRASYCNAVAMVTGPVVSRGVTKVYVGPF